MSQPASIGLTSVADYVDEWYYVDPKNAVQGPFPTMHMQAYFALTVALVRCKFSATRLQFHTRAFVSQHFSRCSVD